jgi:hypothetical protein
VDFQADAVHRNTATEPLRNTDAGDQTISLLCTVDALKHGFQRISDAEVLIEIDGFRDVPVCSESSCLSLVLLGCRRAQDNYRRVLTCRTFADAREDVPSRTFRQIQIEHEQGWALRGAPLDFIQETKCLVSVCEHTKLSIHTGRAECEPNQLDIGVVVFHDRDPIAAGGGELGAISRQRER